MQNLNILFESLKIQRRPFSIKKLNISFKSSVAWGNCFENFSVATAPNFVY